MPDMYDLMSVLSDEESLKVSAETHGEYLSVDSGWLAFPEFFSELNEEFNFTLDSCATKENALCDKYYTIEDNGLTKDWSGQVVWCNPWYQKGFADWVRKCSVESFKKDTVVVLLSLLLPNDSWWGNYVEGEIVRPVECRINMPDNEFDDKRFFTAIIIFGGRNVRT
tara:strand:- start:325 stop:825 length:501 start_codon:yes stop_codon:yes gene_type:complete